MSNQDIEPLSGLKGATITVLLEDENCINCKGKRQYNLLLKEYVEKYFTVNTRLNYIIADKENKKRYKKDKTERYYLEGVPVKQMKYNSSTKMSEYTGRVDHYLCLTKRQYHTSGENFIRTKAIADYFIGTSTNGTWLEDIQKSLPLAVKIVNAYVEDALTYNTLVPEEIAETNWEKANIKQLILPEGVRKDGIIEAALSAPVKMVDHDGLIAEVNQEAVEGEQSLYVYLGKDNSPSKSSKNSRGLFYFFVDVRTGKLYYKHKIKNTPLKMKYYSEKDLSEIDEIVAPKVKP